MQKEWARRRHCLLYSLLLQFSHICEKNKELRKQKSLLNFYTAYIFVLINLICFLLFIQFICLFFLPLSRFSLHSIVACRLSAYIERVWNLFCEHTRWGYYFSRDTHMKYFVTETWNMMLILARKRNLLKRFSAL